MAKVLSKLADIRRKKNMSQEEVAEISGVSVRTIANAEGGKGVTFSTLKHIAKGLEVSAESLL